MRGMIGTVVYAKDAEQKIMILYLVVNMKVDPIHVVEVWLQI